MSTRSQFKPGSDEVMYMRGRLTQEEFLVLFIELNTPLLNRTKI